MTTTSRRGKTTEYRPETDASGRVAFTIRMSPELHQLLLESARDNERALGAEVVFRLKQSIGN